MTKKTALKIGLIALAGALAAVAALPDVGTFGDVLTAVADALRGLVP